MATPIEVTPIKELNQYQNNVTIRARVQHAAPVRSWKNDKGSGKVASADLIDETGEVKCTMFNEEVDAFHPLFTTGAIVEITRPQVKLGNPKFTKNRYELALSRNSEVRVVTNEVKIETQTIYHFIKSIDHIQDVDANTLIDVIGVVRSVSPISTIISKKDQRELTKKDVTICDQSMREVNVTLWGELTSTNFSTGDVVAFKNVRVSEFRDEKQVTTIGGSQIAINPFNIELARTLRDWYADSTSDLGAIKSISATSSQGTGTHSDKNEVGSLVALREAVTQDAKDMGVYMNVVGTIMWSKHEKDTTLYYKSTPDPKVTSKVEEHHNPEHPTKPWYCAKNGQYYESYVPRYILSFSVADHTGCEYVNVFDDVGRIILGVPATVIEEHRAKGEHDKVDQIFDDALLQQFLFRVRAKEELDNNQERRVRFTVLSASKVDYSVDSHRLLERIKAIQLG